MAKKKSKTQKYKKNLKRKTAKIAATEVKNSKSTSPKVQKDKQLVEKNKVNYNVAINSPKNNNIKIKQEVKKENLNNKNNKKNLEFTLPFELPKLKKVSKENTTKIELPKLKSKSKKETQKKYQHQLSILKRLLNDLKRNTHIIFNALIIVTFIIMLIGLIRINVLSSGTIVYISCIVLFLMAVAISYNKYPSGKVFTIILTIGMGFAIYHMQYTYDFIRNLNSNIYEYKTYYVVTFDNGLNKSIYNINNKKVGLLKDNCINIERKLNTKLDKAKYMEYDDINKLFDDFYSQEFRAILVNENQYKYLQNNIQSNREVKILYEFKANAKK